MTDYRKQIYLIKNSGNDTYKIGIGKSPQKRLLQLQTGNSEKLLLIDSFETEYARKIETALHNFYSNFKKEGEWFELSISEEINFRNLCNKIENSIEFLRNNQNIFI